jgi:hypothetical protein
MDAVATRCGRPPVGTVAPGDELEHVVAPARALAHAAATHIAFAEPDVDVAVAPISPEQQRLVSIAQLELVVR